jgi:hypothetical protein
MLLKTIDTFAQTAAADTTEIRLLLEKESATWRSGDVKAHADCWQIRPYSRISMYAIDGTVTDVPPSLMLNPPAGMIGQGGYSVNTNYRMTINKKNAWVSHNEVSFSPDGKQTHSYETRILEKIRGKWKLVGQSIYIYNP